MSITPADLAILVKVARGEVQHDYAGRCPDPVEGYESRDPECPICQLIMRVEKGAGNE